MITSQLEPIVLDHVVLDVHDDMDAAEALYRALGFTLTPRGQHTLGSINHLAMFATDYLELLGWPAAGADVERPELQAFPRGLNGLVFKTGNADASFTQLAELGLAAAAPRAFSRPVALGGETRDAKFRTVNVLADKARTGRIYFCEHLTPELIWRPEYQRHPNGAAAIHSLVIESAEPDAMAALFRAISGEGNVRAEPPGFRVQVGRPFIEIRPGAAPDRITVLRVAGAGSPHVVTADEAGGVRLEFVAG